jgi:hypothetical protein
VRWFGWFRRREKQPDLPQAPHPPVSIEPVNVPQPKPKADGIEVQEHDVSAMSRTGIYRAWRKLSGKE